MGKKGIPFVGEATRTFWSDGWPFAAMGESISMAAVRLSPTAAIRERQRLIFLTLIPCLLRQTMETEGIAPDIRPFLVRSRRSSIRRSCFPALFQASRQGQVKAVVLLVKSNGGAAPHVYSRFDPMSPARMNDPHP